MLERILAQKRREIEELKSSLTIGEMMRKACHQPVPGRFSRSLRKQGAISLIAEIKKASPSKGVIREVFDPEYIARTYAENGASAISVLTDRRFFEGSPGYLEIARNAAGLPLLRKDFILDQVQVYESLMIGADAILLICAILTPQTLRELVDLAAGLGLESLVEVHNETELGAALESGSRLIGINNRDLSTFNTDLDTTFRLIRGIDTGSFTVVSESGIALAADLAMLKESGVHAVLVGEALMRSADLAGMVRELSGFKP